MTAISLNIRPSFTDSLLKILPVMKARVSGHLILMSGGQGSGRRESLSVLHNVVEVSFKNYLEYISEPVKLGVAVSKDIKNAIKFSNKHIIVVTDADNAEAVRSLITCLEKDAVVDRISLIRVYRVGIVDKHIRLMSQLNRVAYTSQYVEIDVYNSGSSNYLDTIKRVTK